jgi:tryptophanyl-tRNA synthetase
MSLQDGNKKMSKSDIIDNSRINLDDEEEIIIKKVKRAKTDSADNFNYHPNNINNSQEMINLVNIFSGLTNINHEKIANDYQGLNYGKFKGDLAEIMVAKIKPIQQNIQKLINEKQYLDKILWESKSKVKDIASQNLKKIYSIIGF